MYGPHVEGTERWVGRLPPNLISTSSGTHVRHAKKVAKLDPFKERCLHTLPLVPLPEEDGGDERRERVFSSGKGPKFWGEIEDRD